MRLHKSLATEVRCARPEARKVGRFAMEIKTTRFGVLELDAEDIISFPSGLVGLESCREWVLLADAHNDAAFDLSDTVERIDRLADIVRGGHP